MRYLALLLLLPLSLLAVMKCTCYHVAQDRLHGKMMRVHNECKDGHRCTVCSNVVKTSGVKTSGGN